MPALSVLLVIASGVADAQNAARLDLEAANYPNRAIRLVVPSAPGGGIDIAGRLTAQRLLASLPQTVVVDNRGGSGGLLGTEIVAKAAPDGYTLLLNGPGGSYLKALYPKLSFDPEKDLTPVTFILRQPWVLAVHPGLAAKSMTEFIQLAKSKPGELRYGTGGVGSASHMGVQLLRSAAKIDIVHVPYKGTGPVTLAVIGGDIQFLIGSVAAINPHAVSGRLRLLAITSAARSTLLPTLPTIAESGVPGYEFDVWYGLFAPVKTPRPVIEKLSATINRSMQQAELRERLSADGLEMVGGTPQQFDAFFRAEITKWRKVIQEGGIRTE